MVKLCNPKIHRFQSQTCRWWFGSEIFFVYQGPVRRTYIFIWRANHCWPWTHNHILVQRMQNHSPSAFPFKTCLFCVTVTSKTPRDAFGLRILICEARTKFQTSVERPVELTMFRHPCQKPRDIRHMQNNQQKIMIRQWLEMFFCISQLVGFTHDSLQFAQAFVSQCLTSMAKAGWQLWRSCHKNTIDDFGPGLGNKKPGPMVFCKWNLWRKKNIAIKKHPFFLVNIINMVFFPGAMLAYRSVCSQFKSSFNNVNVIESWVGIRQEQKLQPLSRIHKSKGVSCKHISHIHHPPPKKKNRTPVPTFHKHES